jgi:hypothetical protein
MESTKVTPRPAMVDAGVSLVLQVAKQKLQEVHEVCKDLAGITTQFLIFKNTIIKLRSKSQLTKEIQATKFKDYKKLINQPKEKTAIDPTIKKVLDIYGNLKQLDPSNLSEKRNSRLLTLFAEAEAIQENLLGVKEALVKLHGEIIGSLTPSIKF